MKTNTKKTPRKKPARWTRDELAALRYINNHLAPKD